MAKGTRGKGSDRAKSAKVKPKKTRPAATTTESATDDPLVSVVIVADFLGLTTQRIHQLVKLGAPKIGVGQFPLKAFVRWYIDHWKSRADSAKYGTSYQEARRRLVMSQAEIKEQQAAKYRGDLVPADEVQVAWGRLAVFIKSRIRSLPSQLAPRLAILEGPAEVQDVMLAAIDAAFDALAAEPVETSRRSSALDEEEEAA